MAGSAPTQPTLVSAAVGRMNRRLIPFLLLMYVMAFLDRTNIGFAQDALEGEFGIDARAYALGASLFFVGYALLEVPSNLLLVRFGARRWMARIMVTWGLVAAAMMFVQGERSFYLLRTLLGIAEAGFFPGVIFYLTRFYPAEHRGRALGLFYFGAPISFVLGGPISGALLELDGTAGLAGWQWLFLVEGLAAALVGVAALFVLRDRPAEVAWLTQGEKAAVLAQLEREGSAEDRTGGGGVCAILRLPVLFRLAGIYASIQLVVYGLVFFLPQQIGALLGRKVGFGVGLVTAVPWLVALVAAWWVPRRTPVGSTARTAGVTLAVAGIGVGVSNAAAAGAPLLAFAGLCVAAGGVIAVQPLFWSLATGRLGGRHSVAGIALVNAIGAAASFAAPNVRVAVDAGTGLSGAGLYALALMALVGALGLTRITRRS